MNNRSASVATPNQDNVVNTTEIDGAANSPLRSSLPMDDAEFRAIVVGFVERLGSQLTQLNRALDDGDWEEIARLAHWLKGAGGTMGFAAFTEPASQLQEKARNQEIQSIPGLIAEICGLAGRIEVPHESVEAI